jgi:hypothetical protein
VATTVRGGRRRSVGSAVVSFAGARARTDRHGRAVIVHHFVRAGMHRARACKVHLGCGVARVYVLLRGAAP